MTEQAPEQDNLTIQLIALENRLTTKAIIGFVGGITIVGTVFWWGVSKEYETLDAKIAAMDYKISAMDNKIDVNISALDDKMKTRFEAMDNKMTTMSESLDTRLSAIEKTLKELKNN